MKNTCKICKKEVIYPEGVYLKHGREVHTKCIQELRKQNFQNRRLYHAKNK